MAVETLNIYAEFSGDGSTTAFPFAFPVQFQTDVALFYIDGTTSPPTQYAIAPGNFQVALNQGDPALGGTVYFLWNGAAAPAGSTVIVTRYVPPLQSVEINNQDGFEPTIVTDEFDRLTMVDQQITDGVSRAIVLPPGDPATGTMILPGPAARANTTPGFDGNGNLILNATNTGGAGGGGPVVPVSAPLLGSSLAGSLVTVTIGTGLVLDDGALNVIGQALPPNAPLLGTNGSSAPVAITPGAGLSISGTVLNATAAVVPASAPLMGSNSGGTLTPVVPGTGITVSGGTISAIGATTPAKAYLTGSSAGTLVPVVVGQGLGITGYGGTLYCSTPLNAALLSTGGTAGLFQPVALGSGLTMSTVAGTKTLGVSANAPPLGAAFVGTNGSGTFTPGYIGAGLTLSAGGTLSATEASAPANAGLINTNSAGAFEAVVVGTGLSLSGGNTLTATAASFPASAAVLASSGGSIVGLSLGGGLLSAGGTLSSTVAAPSSGLVSSNGTSLTTTTIGAGLSYSSGTLALTIAPPAAGLVSSTGTSFTPTIIGAGLNFAAGTLTASGAAVPPAGVVLSNGTSLSAAALGGGLSLGGGTLSGLAAPSAGLVLSTGTTLTAGTIGTGLALNGGGTLSATGGSGSLDLVQGTLSIAATTLTLGSNLTLSGSTPHGTLTASGGGGGGITYTRPTLIAFSAFGTQTALTTAELDSYAGAPITMTLYDSTGALGAPNLCGISNGSLNATEYMVTAYFKPIMGFNGATGNGAVGIGLANAAGQLFTVGPQSNGLIYFNTYNSTTSQNNNFTDLSPISAFGNFWRIYFNATGTFGTESAPFVVLNSYDGASWTFCVRWGGNTGPWTGMLEAVTAFFFLNVSGQTVPLSSSLYHWDVQVGTGNVLNPLSPCSPL